MDTGFAQKGIGILFLVGLANVVWHEWGDSNNPSQPWPRPCKLIVVDLGFAGLFVFSTFAPRLAFWVTAGLVLGELLTDQGLVNSINSTFASANKNAAAAG